MTNKYEGFITEITQSIYSTMLNIDVARTNEPGGVDQESLLAAVQIAGEWMGSVVLALSPEAASESAAAMLQSSCVGVTDADREDVAAELVNMIGGNLKSLLPGPSLLSLPTIVAGREVGMQIHNAELVDDVAFRSQRGQVRVRLFEKRKSLAI